MLRRKGANWKRMIAAAAAAVLSVSLITGCGENGAQENSTAKLKWYFIGTPSMKGSTEIYRAASDLVKKDLGFEVDFVPLETGAYNEKMKLIISSGEGFDICWTSNWLNDYAQNVTNGAFTPLDELLDQAPALKVSIPEQIWEGVKIDNKIYGVPNQQIMARSTCLAIPKEYYDQYGSTLTNVKKYEDLTGFMDAFSKDHPAVSTVAFGWNDLTYSMGFEEILGAGIPGAVRLEGDKNDIKVYNQYATEEFKNLIMTRKAWTQQGYSVQGMQNNVAGSKFNPEQLPFEVITYKPGLAAALTTTKGCEMVTEPISDAYLTRSGVTATINAISASSKHKEEAIKLLEYVNTTSELINLLTFGIEGVNYTKVDEHTVKKVPSEEYTNYEWVFGNVYNSYLIDGQESTVWEDTQKMNSEAKVSRIIAFTPNTSEISLEMNNCKSVVNDYMSDFNSGFGDTEAKLAEMLNKLEAAGVQKVIDNLQKQIDEWLAAR